MRQGCRALLGGGVKGFGVRCWHRWTRRSCPRRGQHGDGENTRVAQRFKRAAVVEEVSEVQIGRGSASKLTWMTQSRTTAASRIIGVLFTRRVAVVYTGSMRRMGSWRRPSSQFSRSSSWSQARSGPVAQVGSIARRRYLPGCRSRSKLHHRHNGPGNEAVRDDGSRRVRASDELQASSSPVPTQPGDEPISSIRCRGGAGASCHQHCSGT